MSVAGVHEIVRFLLIFTLVVIAALHLTDTIESTSLFGSVLIIAIAVVAFQLGMQYSELNHS
ncbi:hypothetical protein [Halosimplex pelagicum]|uniref:Uncharacterized protein n=1 Tax=Halosimplex pelagicum TaxID=869886 RepID=A0A7D5PD44_9EURY|nr:hypothetical protein [Halosimplex pelagicum]QLH82998.1 hypothetical protein HZS54_15795 [Halosimplex pelagicum]